VADHKTGFCTKLETFSIERTINLLISGKIAISLKEINTMDEIFIDTN
jgi:hypothetical protein